MKKLVVIAMLVASSIQAVAADKAANAGAKEGSMAPVPGVIFLGYVSTALECRRMAAEEGYSGWRYVRTPYGIECYGVTPWSAEEQASVPALEPVENQILSVETNEVKKADDSLVPGTIFLGYVSTALECRRMAAEEGYCGWRYVRTPYGIECYGVTPF